MSSIAKSKLKLSLLLFTVAATFFVSCREDRMDNRVKLQFDEVDCNSTAQFLSIYSDMSWRIEMSDAGGKWCSVSPVSGSGSKNVVVSYSANTDSLARKAVIRVVFNDGEDAVFAEFVQLGKDRRPDNPDDPDDPDDPDNPDNPDNPDGLKSDRVNKWMELPKVKSEKNHAYVSHRAKLGSKEVRNYSMYYDADNRIALWVAYPIVSDYIGGSGRTNAWDYDPKIPVDLQPDLHSGWPARGYDRGHQLPSGSRTGSKEINSQTFYYTNMTAQVSSFNQGVWANMENKVRGYASTCDTLYVVTGPILTTDSDSDIEYTRDNSGRDVAVPKAYFKVLLKYNVSAGTYYSIAYYYENRSYGKRSQPEKSDLKTVAQIEAMTGITFFPNLPDEVETAVKQQYEPNRWGF